MGIEDGSLVVLDDIDMIGRCDPSDPCIQTKPDPWAKPRYIRFHPSKRFFFVNYEAANLVDVFSYTESGEIAYVNGASVIDMERRTANNNMDGYRFEAQDLKISDDGAFLYDAYRCFADDFKGTTRIHKDGGFQGVAVFVIDQESGEVQRVQDVEYPETVMEHTAALYEGTGGSVDPEAKGYYWPRSIEIAPDGKFLLVAFLHGDWVASTSIGEDGRLDVDVITRYEMNTPSGMTFITA